MKKSLLEMLFYIFISASANLIFAQQKAVCGEPIELKLSHFVPVKHVHHEKVLEPWARKIEALTNGRVRITIIPNQELGSASEQYDLVYEGVADISFGLPDYTPGHFPLTACIKLPFMIKSAEAGSLVLWDTYEKYLKNEYKDVKVLALSCVGPAQLFTTKKHVKTLEDLRGMKIRTPDPFVSKVLEQLGAIPVKRTITEAYGVLKSGEVDGIVSPWEGMNSFKFYEPCKYYTVINLYSMPLFVIMNKHKYESLPEDIRKIIDKNSGEKLSALSGRVYDQEDIKGRKLAEENGGITYQLPPKEVERWKRVAMPIGDEWIEDMRAKGLLGQEVLSHVVDLLVQLQR